MRAADKMSTRKVLEPPRALIISSYAQALADVRKFRRYKIRAGETALTAHIRFNAERQARLEVLYAAARVRFNS